MEFFFSFLSFIQLLGHATPPLDVYAAVPPVYNPESTKLALPQGSDAQKPGPNKVANNGADMTLPTATYQEGTILDDEADTFANDPFFRNLTKSEVQKIADEGIPNPENRDPFTPARQFQTRRQEIQDVQAQGEATRLRELQDGYAAGQQNKNSDGRSDNNSVDIANPRDSDFDLILLQYNECKTQFGEEHCRVFCPDSAFEAATENSPDGSGQSLCKQQNPNAADDIIGDPHTSSDA